MYCNIIEHNILMKCKIKQYKIEIGSKIMQQTAVISYNFETFCGKKVANGIYWKNISIKNRKKILSILKWFSEKIEVTNASSDCKACF